MRPLHFGDYRDQVSPRTFATIFVIYRSKLWEAKFYGRDGKKSREVNGRNRSGAITGYCEGIGWKILRGSVISIKCSPYSTTERRVPELIPVLGSQPAGDESHKPGGRLSLLSARPAVTPATLNRAATNFAAR